MNFTKPPKADMPRNSIEEAVRKHQEALDRYRRGAVELEKAGRDLNDTVSRFNRTGQFELSAIAREVVRKLDEV